jgi:hypothetical protein
LHAVDSRDLPIVRNGPPPFMAVRECRATMRFAR